MTLKTMLLLAVSAMALAAFALPAAASADDWYTDDTPIGGVSEKDAATLVGEMSFTGGGGLLVLGPCSVEAEVDIWNENGTGTAIVTDFSFASLCNFSIFGVPCEVQSLEPLDLNWHVDVEAETLLNVTGGGVVANIGGECPLGGWGATGNLTGIYNNGTHCMEFEESGDWKGITGGIPALVHGTLCHYDQTLTLKEEE